MSRVLKHPATLLALFVLGLNLNALSAFFVGDDYDYLRWFVEIPLSGVFTMEFWGEWEPVWYLTWVVDQQLWGANPVGYHVQNVLWLMLLTLSLFGLLRAVRAEAPFLAWAAALLFAANPIHDEAVVYLAARGHLMCAAFSVLALGLYAHSRQHPRLRIAAWSAAALAILSKEIALLLPLWVAVLEWGVMSEDRRRLRRALAAGAGFALVAASIFVLRARVIGLESDKLAGGTVGPAELFADLVRDLPGYALLGGLPLPFGLLDGIYLERFRWLGLVLLAFVAVVALAAFVTKLLFRDGRHVTPGLYLLALTVIATGLFPVFWAGLELRRRYLFVPSVGIVIVAALVLDWFHRRQARVARIVLAILVVAGSVATLQRNDVYRRAGNVARNMIETIREAPIGGPLAARARAQAVLTALPDRYGGDAVSGAYLFHRTDFVSALTFFGVGQPWIDYAMRPDHGEDYTAEVVGREGSTVDVRVSFRSRRAFDDARLNDPAAKPNGETVHASRISLDPTSRTMTFRLKITAEFGQTTNVLYLYSDGNLTPIYP